MEEFARAAVVEAVGERVRVQRVDTLHSAETSVVMLIELARPPQRIIFKARRQGAGGDTDYARTAAIVDLARAAGAPVAAVMAADTSYRIGPWQYLLQEHIAGAEWRRVRPLLSDSEVEAVHHQLAEAVLAIQSVRFDSYGELDGHTPPTGGTLSGSLRRRAQTRIRASRNRQQAFLRLLDQDEHLFTARPGMATLCHDDLHHSNVVLDQQAGRWRVTGLLDWDKAWAGPAESDIARMAFWDDMTGPGFWRTYRAAVPADPGWEQRMLIYQLLWCFEYDDGSPRHAADTDRVLHRLGIRVA